MKKWRVITSPTVEPLTVAAAKKHLVLETNDDDSLVADCIKAAREYSEKYLGRGILAQTLELTLNAFPCAYDVPYGSAPAGDENALVLPHGQLAASNPVTYVKYIDANGALQTLDSSAYEVETCEDAPGIIRPVYASQWPATRDTWNAVQVRYVVGWATPDEVPSSIVSAMKLLVSQMYEHRTPEVTGTIMTSVKFSYEALLQPYRFMGEA